MTVDIQTVNINSVTLDPANVRRHSDRNLEVIKGSLARFGQQKPIVVGTDGVVVPPQCDPGGQYLGRDSR